MKDLDQILFDALKGDAALMEAVGDRVVSTCFEVGPDEMDNTPLPCIIVTDDGWQNQQESKDTMWESMEDRVTVLDVGQGQCVLLQSGGRNYLVDCGGDSDTQAADTAAETLLSMGIHKLDGVIVTHYDRDHAGGVGYLLSRIAGEMNFLSMKIWS